MNEKNRELIGIAASITGHCRPCFQYHYTKAKELGISNEDIKEAIELATSIGKAGDQGMHEFANKKMKK